MSSASKAGVGLVERDGHVGGHGPHQALHDVQRLFRHDKFHRDGAGDVFADVFDQLVGIGGHEDQPFGGKFEQHAGHHRAHIVIAGGEDGLLDGRGQYFGSHDRLGDVFQRRQGGVIVGLFVGNVAFTFVVRSAVTDLQQVGFRVGRERDGLFREGFEYFGQHFGRNGDLSGGLPVHVDGGEHGGFQVGSQDGQPAVFLFEQKIVEYRQGAVRADDTAQGVDRAHQYRTGYGEFHNYFRCLFFELQIYLKHNWAQKKSVIFVCSRQ